MIGNAFLQQSIQTSHRVMKSAFGSWIARGNSDLCPFQVVLKEFNFWRKLQKYLVTWLWGCQQKILLMSMYHRYKEFTATEMSNSHFTAQLVPRKAVICDYQLLWMVHLFHSHYFWNSSSVLYSPLGILSWNQDNKPLWAKKIVWSWL